MMPHFFDALWGKYKREDGGGSVSKPLSVCTHDELWEIAEAVRKRYELRRRLNVDGGPGSGNWGHKSVKGKKGGSAPGGGKHNRITTETGGYTSTAKQKKALATPHKPKEDELNAVPEGSILIAEVDGKKTKFMKEKDGFVNPKTGEKLTNDDVLGKDNVAIIVKKEKAVGEEEKPAQAPDTTPEAEITPDDDVASQATTDPEVASQETPDVASEETPDVAPQETTAPNVASGETPEEPDDPNTFDFPDQYEEYIEDPDEDAPNQGQAGTANAGPQTPVESSEEGDPGTDTTGAGNEPDANVEPTKPDYSTAEGIQGAFDKNFNSSDDYEAKKKDAVNILMKMPDGTEFENNGYTVKKMYGGIFEVYDGDVFEDTYGLHDVAEEVAKNGAKNAKVPSKNNPSASALSAGDTPGTAGNTAGSAHKIANPNNLGKDDLDSLDEGTEIDLNFGTYSMKLKKNAEGNFYDVDCPEATIPASKMQYLAKTSLATGSSSNSTPPAIPDNTLQKIDFLAKYTNKNQNTPYYQNGKDAINARLNSIPDGAKFQVKGIDGIVTKVGYNKFLSADGDGTAMLTADLLSDSMLNAPGGKLGITPVGKNTQQQATPAESTQPAPSTPPPLSPSTAPASPAAPAVNPVHQEVCDNIAQHMADAKAKGTAYAKTKAKKACLEELDKLPTGSEFKIQNGIWQYEKQPDGTFEKTMPGISAKFQATSAEVVSALFSKKMGASGIVMEGVTAKQPSPTPDKPKKAKATTASPSTAKVSKASENKPKYTVPDIPDQLPNSEKANFNIQSGTIEGFAKTKQWTWDIGQIFNAQEKIHGALEKTPTGTSIKTPKGTTYARMENGNFLMESFDGTIKEVGPGYVAGDIINTKGANVTYGGKKALEKVTEIGKNVEPEKTYSGSTWGSTKYGFKKSATPDEVQDYKNRAAKTKLETSKETYDQTHREDAGKVWNKASSTAKHAAYSYTQGSGKYNNPLRGIDWMGPTRKKEINELTKMVASSKMKKDTTLQRWVSTSSAAKFLGISESELLHCTPEDLVGMEGKDDAFMSCGSVADSGFTFNDCTMNIFCPKGTQAMYCEPFSAYGGDDPYWDGQSGGKKLGNEIETVLQRGTKVVVTGARWENGKLVLDAIVTGQDPKKLD